MVFDQMKSLKFYADLSAEFTNAVQAQKLDLVKISNLGKKLKLEGLHDECEVCFTLCLKGLGNFIAAKQIDHCLLLENLIYTSFVKTTETEEHYFSCFNKWSSQFQALGKEQQRAFSKDTDPGKLCFVFQNAVLLGHTEVMLATIDAWAAAGLQNKIFAAALGSVDSKFKSLLDERNITLLTPATDAGQSRSISGALVYLREQLQNLGVQSVVWLSVPTTASYALALKLAPRQIFWSLKFRPFYIPEVDVHLCGGRESEPTREYNGQLWTATPFPLTVAFKENAKEDIRKFRNNFPSDATILGSLAREDKINSQAFLTVVCTILSRNPKAHFLWTGREKPSSVVSAFDAHNVSDRCHFIGWVDSNLVADAIDIFLDTFPMGCGVTAYQAMGHATPVLSLQGPETLYGTQIRSDALLRAHGAEITPAFLESLEILTAADCHHYVELAQKLIDDPVYRNIIGQRQKDFYSNERRNLPRYAKRLLSIFTGQEK